VKNLYVLMFVAWSSTCLGQNDSMIVEMMNGTIRGYPISSISQISFSGGPMSVGGRDLAQKVLSSFLLYQNYPNPFNPNTAIQYNLPKSGQVEINIFDVNGRLTRSLFNAYQNAGIHTLVWDSRNNGATIVASGTYFCQVIFNRSALINKLMLVK
jgi:FlgD Ig-like domain